MDQAAGILLQVLYSVSTLALISVGLAVIFGMMRVINLAHGEFMTLGAYAAIVAHTSGVNIYVSILIVAPIVTGLFGLLVERAIIRFLYGRLINTMLATWGLSLAMIGGFSMIFGNTMTSIASPIGPISFGGFQISGYNIFIIGIAILILVGLFCILRYTRAGLIARGTMADGDVAQAFGYNQSTVFMTTFVAGSALSGLAGAVLAPLKGLQPTSGGEYIAKAFITVITGGTSVVTGTISSSAVLGTVNQAAEFASTSAVGEIALLVAAVVLLRLLPTGITGRFLKNKV